MSRRLVELLGRPDTKRRADPVPIEGVDEVGAFERQLEHWFQRVVECRIVGGVVEIRNQHHYRIVLLRWRRRPREPPRGGDKSSHERHAGRDHARRETARLWNRYALVVESIEIRRELFARLETLVRFRLEAARNDPI